MLILWMMGFSSGLPLPLTGSTLQAWFSSVGLDLLTIGMLSLVGQPYAYKFLWAPFLDRYTLPFLGKRRSWILLAQCALAVGCLLMGSMHPQHHTMLLASMALMVAFFSATQDIAIDAYRTDLLSPEERGLGTSSNIMGYRVALLLSSGGMFILADHWGWFGAYAIMSFLLFAHMIVTYYAEPLDEETAYPQPKTLHDAVVEPFREFLSRPATGKILLLIVLYKLADAFALTLHTVFLLREVHLSLTEIGVLYKIVSFAATLLGCAVGGWWMLRASLFRALCCFAVLQGLSMLPFILLSVMGKYYSLVVFSVFSEAFCSGLGSVALTAFLMLLCNRRYTATQFALFSALSAVGRIFIGPFAALVAACCGWTWFFLIAFLLCFPALLILYLLRPSGPYCSVFLGGVDAPSLQAGYAQ